MAIETRTLVVGFGANTIQFSDGVKRVKNELSGLNVDLTSNKQELSKLSTEYKSTEKQMKLLSAAIKATGGTEKQKTEYDALSTSLSTLSVKIGTLKADQTALKSEMRLATNELKEHQQGLRGVSQESDSASKTISNLGTAFKALVMGYSGKKLFDFFIGSNADIEQYMTSFETMLGSASKAKTLVNDLVTFAGNTPMTVDGSIKNADLLMNYGLLADDVIKKMTQLGDLSKGNEEKMGRVSLAYGQMLAKGKVTGEELRQMTEAGVPLLKSLAETIGVSTAELQKMISAGKVGIPELDKAIEGLTTGTGKFAEMMEKQSKTMNGLLSSLKDEFNQIGRDVGSEGFVEVKEVISDILQDIRDARKSGDLTRLLQEVGSGVSNTIKLFTGAVRVLWEYKDGIAAGVVAMGAFKTAMAIQSTISTTVNAVTAYKKATDAASVSQGILNTVMSGGAWMVVAALAAAAAGTYAYFAMQTDTVASKLSGQSKALKEMNNDMNRAIKNGQEAIVAGNDEIVKIQAKVDIYEELRSKLNRTSEEEAALKGVVEELQSILPDNISLIDSKTGAYLDQANAIDKVIEKMTAEILLSGKKVEFEQAVINQDKLSKQMIEAEDLVKNAKPKSYVSLSSGIGTNNKIESNEIISNHEIIQAEINLKNVKKQYEESGKVIEEYKKTLEDFYSKYPTTTTTTKSGLGSSSKKENPLVTKSKQAYSDLRFLRDADLISEDEYLSNLTQLRDTAKSIDEELYRKYYLEIYNIQKSANEKMLSEEEKAASALAKAKKDEFTQWLKDSKSLYDKEYKEKINRVNEEIKVEEKRISKLIANIDAEIKARQRLKEETDSNKQIDVVKAKLQFAQLDDFSRMELEKELAKLQEEKKDREWMNAKEDEKETLKTKLANYKDIAEQQKQLFADEKDHMYEMFDFIGANFSSLTELQASGIGGVFKLIQSKTEETAAMYSTVVGQKVSDTFDYAIDRAKQAIAELNNAVSYAKTQASSVIAAANKTIDNAKKVVNNNVTTNITNPNLSSGQIAKKVDDLFYNLNFSVN